MSPVPPFVVSKQSKHVPQVNRINSVGVTRPKSKTTPAPSTPSKKK
jgi:hypothetical protein